MHNKKSQSAVEFITILGAALFMFVAFFGVIQFNSEEKNSEKEKIILQNIALDVRDEISMATESSQGYYREFIIPENILGRSYTINITENSVYIFSKKHSMSYKIPEVNGSIQKGVNIIKKENETIYLN